MASRKVSYLVNHVIRWQASNEIIISGYFTHDSFHKEDNMQAYVKKSRKIIRLLGRAFRKKNANYESNSQEKNSNQPHRGILRVIQRLKQLKLLQAR